MKSADFLGKLSEQYVHSPNTTTLVRTKPNRTARVSLLLLMIMVIPRAFYTQTCIFIFAPVSILLLVVCLVCWQNGVSLGDFPYYDV